jgi:hypothetical protein
MSWALRRQIFYIMIVVLTLALILFGMFYKVIFKPASCFDKKQNGGEFGIDCGGACALYCANQVSEPVVLWSRAFPVIGSNYNLLAYVENQNKRGAVRMADYEFKIYDTNNQLIGTRSGTTFIPPNQRFPIFESRFDAGASVPRSVTFSFKGNLVWVVKDPVLATLPLRVDRIILGEDTESPNLSARISNESIYDLPEFDVITILYDSMHNAIAVSKTHKDGLPSNASSTLLFTWPNPFSDTPVKNDVITMINPFSVSF